MDTKIMAIGSASNKFITVPKLLKTASVVRWTMNLPDRVIEIQTCNSLHLESVPDV